MSGLVVDDVLDVLDEISRLFRANGSNAAIPDLRKSAVFNVAQRGIDASRFSNRVSADNSILDACVRRLDYTEASEFDEHVAQWLLGNSEALKRSVDAKTKTENQRQRVAVVFGVSILQPQAPQAFDLAAVPAERVVTTISRIVRDTQLSKHIKALHNYECQVCGHSVRLADGSSYAEGHHIQPLGAPHSGPDVAGNIVCLCPNHHAACDLGAIRLDRNSLRSVVGHAIEQSYIDYHK